MWGILKRVLATSLLVGLLAVNPLPVLSATASSPGKVCPKAGQTLLSGGMLYTCIKSGSKLVWNAGKPVTQKFVKTPTPRISGAAVVDETLTANPGSWDEGVLLSYQWLSGGSAIGGADDRTYVPSDNDLSKKISVRVTGSKEGFSSVSRVSAQTANVRSANVTAPVSQTQKVFKTTSVPRITGSPKVGGELIAQVGQWDSGVTFRYQWIKNNVAIPGANRFSYIPTQDDLGTFVTVAVTGTKKGFRNATQISDVAFITASLNFFPSVSLPQVQGSAVVGSTLTAVFSDWGVSGIQYTYQWTRNGLSIPNANSRSYRLTNADLNSFIAVLVSGSRSGYFTETRTSNEVGPVQGVSAPPLLVFANATDPSVSGSLTPGSTLTASHGAWDSGVTYSFQWYQNGLAITGATLSTYEIRATDVGRTLSVALTGSKSGYASQSRTRQAGVVTAATFANAPTPTIEGLAREGSTLTLGAGSLNWSSPAQTSIQWLKNGVGVAGATGSSIAIGAADIGAVFTVAVTGSAPGYTSTTKVSAPTSVVSAAAIVGSKPTISGTAQVGQILTANPGYWESGVSLAYQWMRNGTSIPGASSATYTLVTEDNATQVSVEVTGSKSGMPNLVQVSNAVSVTTTILTLTPTPTISGTPQVGQTLTANAGTWDSGVTLKYQWYSGVTAITGATTSTWTIQGFNAGTTIYVSITGSKTGFVPVTRNSSTLNVPIADFSPSPEPVISGSAVVGQTLQANTGNWQAGAFLARQWLRNGIAITSATSLSYVLTAADAGANISFRVTASATGFNTVTRTSTSLGPVQLGTLVSTPSPTIASTLLVNGTASVTRGTWDSGTSLSQQWLRDGAPIPGAIGTSYTVTSADFGSQISVSVTGTKAGFSPVTKVSNSANVSSGSFVLAPTPTITGTARFGQTLTANPGTWDTGTTFAYQWRRGSIPIAGATQRTYVLTLDDISTSVSVEVTGIKTGVTSTSRVSSGRSISEGLLSLTPTPTFSGVAVFGSTLTGSYGTWDSDVSLMGQWLRNGIAISGATGNRYTLTADDVGASVSWSVTGSKTGFVSVVRNSTALTVAPAVLASSPIPTVSGVLKLDDLLTVQTGSWDAGVTFGYQWLANGVAISGATTSTFRVGLQQVGQSVTVRVTGSKPGHGAITRESSPSSAVIADTFASQPEPFATYNAELVKQATMFGNAGDWGQGASISYQWMFGPTNPIVGATSQTYLVTDQYTYLYLQITVTKPGVIPVTKISGRYTVQDTGITQLDVSLPSTIRVGQTINLSNTFSWVGPKRWRVEWKRNGVVFDTTLSADSTWSGVRTSYVPTQSDVGAVISVAVSYGDFTRETNGCSVTS
jgi:hypothetical protein